MATSNQQQNGRLGGLESWARTTDRSERTRPARENSPANVEYHIARVPAEVTDPAERVKAGQAAHRSHMLRLAYASAKARRAKAANRAA